MFLFLHKFNACVYADKSVGHDVVSMYVGTEGSFLNEG
jgi:hypothetical protein